MATGIAESRIFRAKSSAIYYLAIGLCVIFTTLLILDSEISLLARIGLSVLLVIVVTCKRVTYRLTLNSLDLMNGLVRWKRIPLNEIVVVRPALGVTGQRLFSGESLLIQTNSEKTKIGPADFEEFYCALLEYAPHLRKYDQELRGEVTDEQ